MEISKQGCHGAVAGQGAGRGPALQTSWVLISLDHCAVLTKLVSQWRDHRVQIILNKRGQPGHRRAGKTSLAQFN